MATGKNSLRIIGGQWRGRKLGFADIPELRPTPDRVRETVFNWLQNDIQGSNCIDLFAGSGALGFEALSRGAESCVFIDKQSTAIDYITSNLGTLGTTKGQAVAGDTMKFLAKNRHSYQFDIVFVDPPYALSVTQECIELLESEHWLNDNAYIYIESATPITEQALPNNWQIHRQKKAGNVHYCLVLKTKQ